MKTEVRKEHGDWIVFVDDNPQFSFMYREEAEKVRNLVDLLVMAHEDLEAWNECSPPSEETEQLITKIEQALKGIGAI